jgi:hypothetical protein
LLAIVAQLGFSSAPISQYGAAVAGPLLVLTCAFRIWSSRIAVPRESRFGSIAASAIGVALAIPFMLGITATWVILPRAHEARAASHASGLPGPGQLPGKLDDITLPYVYEPELLFTTDERWHPINFFDFTHRVTLYHLDRDADRVSAQHGRRLPGYTWPDELAPSGSCKRVGHPCWLLSLHCEKPDARCADEPKHVLPRLLYARVSRRHPRAILWALPSKGSKPRFVRKTEPPDSWWRGDPRRMLPFQSLSIIVQYWVFYYYDDWRGPLGLVRQWHPGDWEAITVGLSNTRPLFVAYSAHCGGQWRQWTNLVAVRANHRPGGLHPRIFVAKGSHANYPVAEWQPQNWTTCGIAPAPRRGSGLGGLAFLALRALEPGIDAYSALRDQPPEDLGRARFTLEHPELVDRGDLAFPGYWGGHEHRHFVFGSANRWSPATPACQPLWENPIFTIFCQPDRWKGPAGHCPPGQRKPATTCT